MSRTTDQNQNLVPIHQGFAPLAERYSALLCDVWGVLHDGVAAYSGVVDTLRQYRAGGGKVLLLSNASRPGVHIPSHLAELGIPREAYDDVLTSGDATRASLKTGRYGKRFWHIGPEKNSLTFEGLELEEVSEGEAEFVLCTALFDDEVETPEDYADILARLKSRDMELVCANPDIIVDRGEKQVFCGGSIAEAYVRLGGRAHYFGKPHPPIYKMARERLETLCGQSVAMDKILAVGDGLLTDIKGANTQGFDALFITGGIAVERCGPDAENPQSDLVSNLCREVGVWPTGAMPRLRW
ncbi:MAG: TIGR01459 family HAD-type hydrolase [Parvibaculum sp.]